MRKINYTQGDAIGNQGYHYLAEAWSSTKNRRAVFYFDLDGKRYEKTMLIQNVKTDKAAAPHLTLEYRNSTKGIFLTPQGDQILVDNDVWFKYKHLPFCLNGFGYAYTKLAWGSQPLHLLVMPDAEFDSAVVVTHIDGNRLDNRKSNLRLIPRREALTRRVKGKPNKTGYTGVYKHSHSKKYKAQIGSQYLGYFDTAEEASEAYQAAARQKYPERYAHQDLQN